MTKQEEPVLELTEVFDILQKCNISDIHIGESFEDTCYNITFETNEGSILYTFMFEDETNMLQFEGGESDGWLFEYYPKDSETNKKMIPIIRGFIENKIKIAKGIEEEIGNKERDRILYKRKVEGIEMFRSLVKLDTTG